MKNKSIFLSILCFTTVGIVLAVPILRAEQSVEQSAEYEEYIAEKTRQIAHAVTVKEKQLALAVPGDTPRVHISGEVLLPDGTPLPGGHVSGVCVTLQSFGDNPFMHSYSSDGSINNGEFEVHGFVFGSHVIANFSGRDFGENNHKRFISKPIVLIAHDKMDPLKVKLEEGISVRGKITYANGSPAADQRLGFIQQLEPILGADIPTLKNSLRSSRWFATDAAGEYESFLLPGEYTVSCMRQRHEFTLAETDTEKRFDLTLPTPIFCEVMLEDGTLPKEIQYRSIRYWSLSEHGFSGFNGRRDNSFVIDPIMRNGMLFITDASREQGTIETLTPEMVGKTIRFKLKPMGVAVITLVDAAGNPMADRRVRLRYYHHNVDAHLTTAYTNSSRPDHDVFTDSEGKATLRVLPGKVKVEITYPGGNVIKELDLAPGEIFDFGTVQQGTSSIK